jgi:flagella basal body P-ring formation protein FlgA
MLTTLGTLLLSGVTVALPMEAESFGTEIELGEIATVTGDDPVQVALVEAVELGYAPSPGYSRLLHAARILEVVERRAPGTEVRFTGQRACRVRPKVEEVTETSLLAAAREQLRGLVGADDVTYAPSAELPQVVVPAGRGQHTLRARAENMRLATGLVSIPVEVLVDGEVYRTVWTSWQVAVWSQLPVVTRRVRVGEVIQPSMLETRRVRIEAAMSAKPLPASLLHGAVAAREIGEGRPVTDLDVHRPVAVEVGDTVSLLVRRGRVSARVSAVARQSGSIGDRIRVTTLEGGRELTANVVRKDVVEVDLGK